MKNLWFDQFNGCEAVGLCNTRLPICVVVFAREAKLLKTGMNQDYSLMSPELYLHLYECAS